MKAPLPDNETERLEALGRYNILDTAPEEAFDNFTSLAAQICEAPIALITLIDSNRQWIKSCLGLTLTETAREVSFCTHAILNNEVLVVPDAWADERFATNAFVLSRPYIRFYAGAPLIAPGGYALGTLCVMDYVRRELNPKQLQALQTLSRQVIAQLELRRTLAELTYSTQQSQQLEKKLHLRERELLDLFEKGTVGLHCVDANGIIIWVNQAELDLLGYTREEYVGHYIAEFHADRAVIDDILQRLTRNETLNNYEAKLRCKDGSFRHVLINSSVLWEDGKFSHTRCFTRDITEYKQTEAERDRFFNLSLDLLCIAGLDGYFKRLNPAWETTFGYANQELQRQPFLDFVHPEDQAATITEVEKLTKGKPTTYFENRYRSKDGLYKWLAWTAFPNIEEGFIYCVARDITQLKQAERERLQLLQREQAARAESEAARNQIIKILESITDAFFALDDEWRFTYLNQQAERLLRRKREELSGQCIWDEFPEAVDSPFDFEYHRAVREQVSVEFEAFYPPLNSWFSVHAYPREQGLSVYFEKINQRKQAEEALRSSEERYRLLFETNPHPMWVFDVETLSFLAVNEAAIRHYGYSRQEFLAMTIEDIRPPEDVQTLLKYLGKVKSGLNKSGVWRHRKKDGTMIEVEITTHRLTFAGRQADMVLANDVTERRRAERALLETTQLQRAILDSANYTIISTTPDGIILTFNAAAERLLGYTAQEVVGQVTPALIHDPAEVVQRSQELTEELGIPIEPGFESFVAKARLLGEPDEREWTYIRKDGSRFPVLLSVTALRDLEGNITGFLGIGSDITERKQAEEELQRQNWRSQLFAEITLKIRQSLQLEEILQTTVTEVQKILNCDRVLLYRVWPNGTGCVVTEAVRPGWPAILGMTFQEEVFPTQYQELYRQGQVRAIADVGRAYAEIVPCLLKFLQPWGVKAKLVVPILQNNQLWGLLIAHHCTSPRQWTTFETELLQQLSEQIGLALAQAQLLERETRQRLELARSNAELQEFAYVASHDLQEPLRKIQAFGDRLQVKYSEVLTEQGRDYLQRMQNAAQRMQALINDLLTLSRITTRAQPFVPTNLRQVVQEVLSDLEVRIQQTGARVEVDELPTLEADPVQMRQLLQNLIGNALKFHRDDEPPAIEIYSQQLLDTKERPTKRIKTIERYQILIKDNGIGFEEKHLDRIFNAFQRLHGRSEYEGTGMGLAICRKIVERHDGSITAKSQPGQGSTFIVTLPVQQRQGKAEG